MILQSLLVSMSVVEQTKPEVWASEQSPKYFKDSMGAEYGMSVSDFVMTTMRKHAPPTKEPQSVESTLSIGDMVLEFIPTIHPKTHENSPKELGYESSIGVSDFVLRKTRNVFNPPVSEKGYESSIGITEMKLDTLKNRGFSKDNKVEYGVTVSDFVLNNIHGES